MDTPQGRIIEMHEDAVPRLAVVEVAGSLRCARCAAGKGCGAGLLGGGDQVRRVNATVRDDLEVRVGDRVRVALASGDLLQAAMLAYGAPLAGALVVVSIAWGLGFGDLGSSLAALAGLSGGVFLGRLRMRRTACLRQFTPVVIARLGTG